MRSIKVMSRELAEKIAAGEVVERPVSIVKELVENSIDASSTAVTVEIKDGGVSYIRVTDNGSGIKSDEVATAFLRHSTSKMYDQTELDSITSLGFRGEALASISAVAEVSMTTRTRISETGCEILISGGEQRYCREAGCPCGTAVVVRNLFFNVPARRKFLKKASQEAAYTADLVSRLALSNPGISFKLVSDGKTLLHTPGDFNLKSAVTAVYDLHTAENLLKVSYTAGNISINGVIGGTELEKNNKTYQTLFVNNRWVRDNIVSAAVQSGCKNSIMIGKFPMFVLFLTLPPEDVDVNVHPAKAEVRFKDEEAVARAFTDAVATVMKQKTEIPALQEDRPATEQETAVMKEEAPLPFAAVLERARRNDIQPSGNTETGNSTAQTTDNAALPKPFTPVFTKSLEAADRPSAVAINLTEPRIQTQNSAPEQTILGHNEAFDAQEQDTRAFLTEHRLIGQIFNTYIVVESGDAVYLIDQHAAHERLLYERLTKTADSERPVSQQLLEPQTLSLNYAEKARFLAVKDRLEDLGYELEPFGETTYITRSVPVLLGRPCGIELIRDIISDNDLFKGLTPSGINKNKLMQTACKHAIKGGEPLYPEELEEIMRLIIKENIPLSCPHGRPILVKLTRHELELRFKRLQN